MKVFFASAEYVAHQTLASASLDGEDSRQCDNRLPARSDTWRRKVEIKATKIPSAIPRWGPNADIFLFYAAAAAKSVGGFTGQKPTR